MLPGVALQVVLVPLTDFEPPGSRSASKLSTPRPLPFGVPQLASTVLESTALRFGAFSELGGPLVVA